MSKKALEESILHWKPIVKGEAGWIGGDSCALCKEHADSCDGCPLVKWGVGCDDRSQPSPW